MVCVPCLILPILLGIYIKFIQPYILRLLPESWRAKFDAILYPTCPVRAKTAKANISAAKEPVNNSEVAEDSKKTD